MTPEQQSFIESIATYVRKYAPQYGIAVHSPIIAQAILESGWGKSFLASKHNYFGIKLRKGEYGDFVDTNTQEEYTAGTVTNITARFRVFPSMDAGVKGYFDFISASWYSNLKGVTDPYEYIRLIKEDGYATSSTYVQQLTNLVDQYGLRTYDSKASGGNMTSPTINKYHGDYNVTSKSGTYSYIVCHYVGNGTSASGNAKNNCIYFSGGNRGASAHYFIDDGGIWEYADPSVYYTWHCGDGKGKYGITNSNSIGIEVCQNGDVPYTEQEIEYLTQLVGYLMEKYNIPASNVVRHYDASRKSCPYYYAKRQDKWDELKERITSGGNDMPLTDSDISRIWEYLWSGDNSGENCYNKLVNANMYAHMAFDQITRRDDPTGRGVEMSDHEHIKWLAKNQQDIIELIKENNKLLKDKSQQDIVKLLEENNKLLKKLVEGKA